jgi:dihydroorotate dehydrogenase (NAD+) catalytic subunit
MAPRDVAPDLSVALCGLRLKNPVIAASGCFGFGEEILPLYHPSVLGGFSTKGITLRPRQGNGGLRLHETRAGLMNSIGLQNPGAQAFVDTIVPRIRSLTDCLIANVGGHEVEDFVQAVGMIAKSDVDMIELNISCPNLKCGGHAFGNRAGDAAAVVRAVRPVCAKPLMVKLSPNADDIVGVAVACQQEGADALSLVNTFNGLAIDVRARRAVFDNVTAGLSGPAIKPIALKMTRDVCRSVDIPVVGMGGIETGEDVAAFIMAGATAVQVGTAGLARPDALPVIIEELARFMAAEGIADLAGIRGIV